MLLLLDNATGLRKLIQIEAGRVPVYSTLVTTVIILSWCCSSREQKCAPKWTGEKLFWQKNEKRKETRTASVARMLTNKVHLRFPSRVSMDSWVCKVPLGLCSRHRGAKLIAFFRLIASALVQVKIKPPPASRCPTISERLFKLRCTCRWLARALLTSLTGSRRTSD